METKICSECSKAKASDEYYVIKKTGYVYPYCKKCHYSKYTKHTSKRWREDSPKKWNKAVRKAQVAMFSRMRAGVYLLITTKGLYVGATDKYDHRLWQHRHSNFKGNMLNKNAKVLYATLLVEEKNREKRLQLEKEYIGRIRPALNKLHNPDYSKK
tara:strand:- start:1272 stop:1739 length:468 start_codon:yes stop_codon:yes gene_type:complete